MVVAPRCATVVEIRFAANPRSLELLSETLGFRYVAARAGTSSSKAVDPHRDPMLAPVAEVLRAASDGAAACRRNGTAVPM